MQSFHPALKSRITDGIMADWLFPRSCAPSRRVVSPDYDTLLKPVVCPLPCQRPWSSQCVGVGTGEERVHLRDRSACRHSLALLWSSSLDAGCDNQLWVPPEGHVSGTDEMEMSQRAGVRAFRV